MPAQKPKELAFLKRTPLPARIPGWESRPSAPFTLRTRIQGLHPVLL